MDINKINDLIKDIDDLKQGDDFKSYLASPIIKQIINLLEKGYKEQKDILLFSFKTYLYIGETYKLMGRFSLVALYLERALDISLILYYLYKTKVEGLRSLMYDLLKARNYYVDDDCLDIVNKVKGILIIEPIHQQVMGHRRTLKHDPIEMSEQYLSVIDEVEEKIDKNRTLHGMGSCHEIWALKEQYLLEKGIKWKSPQVMNPRVLFD